MLPRGLPSYPTATQLFGSQFPPKAYVNLQKELLSKIAGVAVDLEIKESTGLAFYEVDLNLHLNNDVDLPKQINTSEIAWYNDMSWSSVNNLYEYIIEPSLQIGMLPTQIIVHRYSKKELFISMSLAIHHPTVTPWSILRAVKMIA